MDEDVEGSRADVGTRASVLFKDAVTARLVHSPLGTGFNVVARGSRATMSVFNYWTAFIYHHIRCVPPHHSSRATAPHGPTCFVTTRHHRVSPADGGADRVERIYGGGESNFELQLRAFAGAVRRGERFPTSGDDAVGNMELIDQIYEKAGLGKRPSLTAL